MAGFFDLSLDGLLEKAVDYEEAKVQNAGEVQTVQQSESTTPQNANAKLQTGSPSNDTASALAQFGLDKTKMLMIGGGLVALVVGLKVAKVI